MIQTVSLNLLLFILRTTIGRGEASEEHDLIAKFCQHLQMTQEAESAKPNRLGASNELEDRLNVTPFERHDLIQVNCLHSIENLLRI